MEFWRRVTPAFQKEIFQVQFIGIAKSQKLHFISQSGGPLNFQPVPLKEANKVLLDYYYQPDFPGDWERVYISRNKGNKRLLLNEEDIMPILKKHNFNIIYTEDLLVEEQINIFSRAKYLVSIHGAGLTNMVFMSEGSRILEIRNPLPDHMNNCFLSLANTLKHNYYYFIAEINQMKSERRPIDASLRIDPTKFKACLKSYIA